MKLLLSTFSLLLCLSMHASASQTSDKQKDTIGPLLTTVTDERVLRMLSNDPVYQEYWINDITFCYDSVRLTELPEIVRIPISQDGEKFSPTWYGKLSSGYKWRWGRQHHGVDLGLRTGDPIYAAWGGIVRYAQWNKSGYGNCVVIRHRNGLETLYGHMSRLLVAPNQFVSSGEMIGLGGSTGRSTGPHLHFEIRYKDFSINPEFIIDYGSLSTRLDTFHFSKTNINGIRYSGDINAQYIGKSSDVPTVVSPPDGPSSMEFVSEVTGVPTVTDSASRATELSAALKGTTLQKESIELKTSYVPQKKSTISKKIKTSSQKKRAATYVIQSGDTYTSISRLTGVSIAQLKKLNPAQKETSLKPGKKIKLK